MLAQTLVVATFFINDVGLALVLLYLEDYASENGGLYAGDILALETFSYSRTKSEKLGMGRTFVLRPLHEELYIFFIKAIVSVLSLTEHLYGSESIPSYVTMSYT
jgi:hypothetical protein